MSRPLPRRHGPAQPFWEAAERKELVYQRCTPCGHVQPYPRHRCATCLSDDLHWRTSGGRGLIVSYTIVHRAPSAAFQALVPYTLALIEFDEGFRMMLHLTVASGDHAAVGRKVKIDFDSVEGMMLPGVRLT